jgi:crotonobetainyl-CoA:carnitine CoA-transferase CaiB-like acyl-CoA transferase
MTSEQNETGSAVHGPLSHLRVLDLSRVLAGPWSGQLLADLGAEVIKVERPQGGDDTRGWGPPYLEGTKEAAYYLSCNRGKKSVTIDMATAEGQQMIRDLAAQSDVVLENFKVGGLKKYGLDYEGLRAVKPDLVYCSVTGFGQNGPYALRAGYDFMIQGMGGLMSLTGEPDGMPTKTGVAFADIFTGMYSTVAVLAALAHRDRTGEGQYIDMALLDVQVAVLGNQAMNYLASGKAPQRMGNAHPNIVPYQAFATLDGHIILAVGNDGQFSRFCTLAGRPELAEDERFKTNSARVAHRAELVPQVAAMVASRTTADWIAVLEDKAVPCGPINTLDQVFADPQVLARGMKATLPHPLGGSVDLVGSPIKYSTLPAQATTAPPTLGQHTDSVLAEVLGMDAAQCKGLRDKGII